ncbi:MAG: hypothetical protein FWG67_00295 [Defluviitaleaceae bacterium]|nr:hypothetical protein [Defluviitaleaceae bacterium]
MKKWQKALFSMLAVSGLVFCIGLFNMGTASASVTTQHGTESNPSNIIQSRGWGLMAESNGAVRVRHYRRASNGALTFLSQSGWSSPGGRTQTAWSTVNHLLSAATLQVNTW